MEQKETSQQTFSVQRLYIKESSWKVPYAPGIFTQSKALEPTLSFELQVKNQALPDDIYEVVLQATATAKAEKYTAFIAEVHQAGLFKLAGFTDNELDLILKNHCPTILYPYLARALSDATIHAGFPPLLLPPVNFSQIAEQESVSQNLSSEHVSKSSLNNERNETEVFSH